MAYQKNAPSLYTNKDNLSSETKTRLKELKTKTVIIVGGTPAVSANTANQIKALGISVKRISGSNRYDTATKVAKEMPAASKAVIANGFLYADAIVCNSICRNERISNFVYESNRYQQCDSRSYKKQGDQKLYCSRGTGSINASVFNKLPSPKESAEAIDTNLRPI